jgi:hypothetical protein
MPITLREARQLTTASEWPLVESSFPAGIRTLTPARLKAKIVRARRLRDKYAGLAKKQHRRSRPVRRGTPGEALNARTKRKAALFSEVLARFEAAGREKGQGARDARSAQGAGAAKGARGATKAKARGRDAGAGASAAVRAGALMAAPSKAKRSRAPLVPKSFVATRSGQHRIHAHVSSRGRRRQGRRDSR